MNDGRCVMPNYEEELKIRCAELAELKHAYERAIDDNSKLELQCDMLLKEKSDLDRKIGFLEGQIEAYQYCMNCRQ